MLIKLIDPSVRWIYKTSKFLCFACDIHRRKIKAYNTLERLEKEKILLHDQFIGKKKLNILCIACLIATLFWNQNILTVTNLTISICKFIKLLCIINRTSILNELLLDKTLYKIIFCGKISTKLNK